MRNVHPHTQKTKRRSIIFFEIGMICSLSFALWAFNISNATSDIRVLPSYETPGEDYVEELGKITIELDHPVIEKQEVIKTDRLNIVPDPDPIPDPNPHINPPEPISYPNPVAPIVNSAPPIDPGADKSDFVIIAGKMPSFPGGIDAMMQFIKKEVKYPALAIENGITGRVMVSFIVEKDGSLSHIEIGKSVGWGIDEEAIRVVKLMPNWIPGENNFRPVRVRIALPIKFMFQ